MYYLIALNCGSSSLKSSVYSYPELTQLATLSASSIGSDQASLKVSPAGRTIKIPGQSHAEIFSNILKELHDGGLEGIQLSQDASEIAVVTHRIVHGGTVQEPVVVTREHPEALKRMEELSAFAPLHNHHAVLTVKAVLDALPKAKNLLCFDTLVRHLLIPHSSHSIPKLTNDPCTHAPSSTAPFLHTYTPIPSNNQSMHLPSR